MSGAYRAVAPILLSALAAGAAAAPASPIRTPCALELTGVDDSGNRVLQTVGYTLDRPGILLTSLTVAARFLSRPDRLQVAPDPTLTGRAPAAGPLPVAEVVLADPSRDLLVLHAAGLEACVTSGGSGARASEPDRGASALPTEGEEVIGLRTRDGFRPRVFRGVIDRLVGTGDRNDLMRIRMPDGGGAGTGFLFDRDGRLIGSILPSSPGADPRLACGVAFNADHIAATASGTGGQGLGEPQQRPLEQFARTPTGLLAQALLLTRDDQIDQALRLLDEVERLAGLSVSLLMERGALRFRIGKIDGAIEEFSRAARLDPGRHLAHYDLGIALGAAGRYEGAVEAFTRAQEIDPRHVMTRYQLALALQAANRPEMAREQCNLLSRLDATLASSLKSILGD